VNESSTCCGRWGQDSAWYGASVEGHASLSARHMCLVCRTPGPSLATLPSEMRVRTAAGGPSRPHRRAVAPVAPARAAKPPRSRSAEGVATRGFGCRRGGEVHGPSAGPRNLTGTRAGRGSRCGHTMRRAPRDGWVVVHSARVGGGRPVSEVSEGRGGARWQAWQGGGNFGAHRSIGVDPRLGESFI
jgi:hypothetical protein